MNLLDTPDFPVNLDNVREMLGHDPVREKELFQIFIESADENIDGLVKSTGPGAEENWRTQAHALKGMSLNLGATKLGDLCATAQKGNAASQTEKEAMLSEIQAEYAKVRDFLQGQPG